MPGRPPVRRVFRHVLGPRHFTQSDSDAVRDLTSTPDPKNQTDASDQEAQQIELRLEHQRFPNVPLLHLSRP